MANNIVSPSSLLGQRHHEGSEMVGEVGRKSEGMVLLEELRGRLDTNWGIWDLSLCRDGGSVNHTLF